LTALFWIGHRFCSTWLAYCTEAYRPLLRAQPVRFVVLPLLVTAACFAVFLPSDSALPWTREDRLVVLAILDYAFVTYHFAAQHFGALSLYRVRVGRGACAYARRMDRLYALGIGGVLVFVADILAGGVAYQDAWVDPWLVPAWLTDPTVQHALREGAALVLLASTAVMLCAEACAAPRSLPRALYLLGIAAIVAVGLRPQSAFLFLVLSTSQHWIFATGLASQTPRGEPAPERGAIRHVFHMVNARPWTLSFVLMGLSVLLMPFFEIEANREGGTYYADRIFGAFATGLRTSSWVPALVALGFSTGFVHYLLDRSVYRLSNPEVRWAAHGLLNANRRRRHAARRSRRSGVGRNHGLLMGSPTHAGFVRSGQAVGQIGVVSGRSLDVELDAHAAVGLHEHTDGYSVGRGRPIDDATGSVGGSDRHAEVFCGAQGRVPRAIKSAWAARRHWHRLIVRAARNRGGRQARAEGRA